MNWTLPLLLASANAASLAKFANGVVFLAGLLIGAFLSVLSLAALCVVVGILFPGKVQAAARAALLQPLRCTLLGAINLVGGLVVASRVEPLAGLILLLLSFLAFLGIAGLAGWIAQDLTRGEQAAGAREIALAGGLLATACLFPLLGQAFGILLLCCAIGSTVLGWRRKVETSM